MLFLKSLFTIQQTDDELIQQLDQYEENIEHEVDSQHPSTISTVYSTSTIIEEGQSEEVKSLHENETDEEQQDREEQEDEERLSLLEELSSIDEQESAAIYRDITSVFPNEQHQQQQIPIIRDIHVPQQLVDPRKTGELWPRTTKHIKVSASRLTKEENQLLQLVPLSNPVFAFNFTITLCNREYTLRTWYVKASLQEKEKLAMGLHGYGKGSTKHQFHNLAEILKNTHSVLLITLPGFGLSTGATLQSSRYKRESTYLLKSIIDSFGKTKVNILGQCGGGGVFMRTLSEYPKLFAKRHFLGRPYSAIMPDNLLQVLKTNKIKLWVYWVVDQDHMKCCVPYKTLLALSKKSKCVRLDTEVRNYGDLEWLPLRSIQLPKISRSPNNDIYIYDPSVKAQEDIHRFINYELY
eukprot:CAMPEP_0117423656 /NCGR_PEP_ID=MMETSP0758-20121206/4227_1 /TAXON_ID=63605 /ORGANISM="Percolomonas cosmopolitus, Strain AE-1 (ATCC 50343)" /LENGTH=408 /DNA_ID=CAMNT_0005206957 /DNA_START=605 /DNA_END=1831 /DNA_ORIENTATION=+